MECFRFMTLQCPVLYKDAIEVMCCSSVTRAKSSDLFACRVLSYHGHLHCLAIFLRVFMARRLS